MGKQSRFHIEQIVRILREWETSGLPVSSFLRRYGIGRQTFYRWRRRYGGLSESEAKRLKRLGAGESAVEGAGGGARWPRLA